MEPKERAKNKKYKYLACIYCGGNLSEKIIEGKYCPKCSKKILGKQI